MGIEIKYVRKLKIKTFFISIFNLSFFTKRTKRIATLVRKIDLVSLYECVKVLTEDCAGAHRQILG